MAPPTHPLRPMNPNNAWDLCITAAAGTELAVPSSSGTINTHAVNVCTLFPNDRRLQSEDLHPPRGVARSGFPPLSKILDCCHPLVSGPCLSPSVAGRPLRPAPRQSLAEPLPLQLADRPRAPQEASGCPDFNFERMSSLITCGINSPFGELSPTSRQVAHVLSTRSPLDFSLYCYKKKSRSTCMSYPRRQRSF